MKLGTKQIVLIENLTRWFILDLQKHKVKRRVIMIIYTKRQLFTTSLIVLLSICLVTKALVAQSTDNYPADEKEFMAEANAVHRAGDNEKYQEMLFIGYKRGYADAMAELGAIFLMAPDNKEKNFKIAHKFFRKAADKGHAGAMFMLAESYRKGYGTPKDMQQYKYWMIRAAIAGDVNARHRCKAENFQWE